MRKKSLLTITVLTLLLTSCHYFNLREDDNVVAEVGKYKLYKSDIMDLIPPGTNSADSILMLQQYVDSWAVKYILITKAESELSKEEKDVEVELEEYRSSLIAYRFEKRYIDSHLDTTITGNETMEYYLANSENLKLSSSVVKGRTIKISQNSPNVERIRSMYRSDDLEKIDELESLSYDSAERYNNFNNEWVSITTVARELPIDLFSCENQLKEKNYFEIEEGEQFLYLAYFTEIVYKGEKPPYQYYIPYIKESILSRRKQDLMKKMERDLLQEAIETNKIKVNIK